MHESTQWGLGVKRTRNAWIVIVLLMVVSLPAVTPRLYASDEIQYFAYLRSMWFDGDLSFENEYRYFYDREIARAFGFQETFLEFKTETGLRNNFGTAGSAILWSPFYGIADVAARAMRLSGVSVAIDGYSRPYLVAVAYGSAIYGFLAVLLSIVAARRVIGTGHLAALIVWIGTPLGFYMYVAPGMAHACSAFAVALFVNVWLIVRERWSQSGFIALGSSAALMGMVREQDLFMVIGPAVDFVFYLFERLRTGSETSRVWHSLKRAMLGAMACAICYLPQLFAYLTLYGRIGPAQQVENKMSWFAPYAGLVLFSPENGLLAWTPLVLLCVGGFVLMSATCLRLQDWSQNQRIGFCILLMFVSQVYVCGSLESWMGAGSFGQRRFVGTSVLLTIGLAFVLQVIHDRWYRWAVGTAIVLCVWWNVGLMAQFGAGMMDRQRLELGRNAYTTFSVIPQMLPRLVYRYLFDRSTFYQEPQRYSQSRLSS